ncbi:hypothetical protein FRC01_002040 [Tulasnella sp. 417]|nr:hypothetical protein FRC01_002040 [Tulasnella sp. 417]
MAQTTNVLARPSPVLPSNDDIAQFCLQHDPHPTSVSISCPLPQGGTVWIKFGAFVSLTEAQTQRYVFDRIDPQWSLRVAQVFHEFEKDGVVYIIMEEIQGETVGELGNLEVAVERIACALDEFIRIPPPEGEELGPLGGGLMEHPMFPDIQAATRYESKSALGDHITRILKLTRDRHLDVNFEEDERILWPADFDEANFKFVGDKVYWFHYRNVNILPESFKIHDLTNSHFWISADIGRTYLDLHPATESSTAIVRPLPFLSKQTERTVANAAAIERASIRLWTSGTSSLGLPRAAND